MLTTKKATRAVFSNNLAQNTAVNAGTRLAVTGQSSTSNSFTLAIENGSTDLTPAEYASIIDANTPSYGPPAITFERGVNPMPQNQYTMLPGYTSIAYTLIGGGGGGAGTAGGGGGAGGAIIGKFQAIAGNVIQLYFGNEFDPDTQGTGGAGGVGTNEGSNGDIVSIVLKETASAEENIGRANGLGGNGGDDGLGGNGGGGTAKAPVGSYIVYPGNNGEIKETNGGNGGTLSGGLTFAYGGGGGGAGDSSAGGLGFNGGTAGTTDTGGNGGNPYYKIVIT